MLFGRIILIISLMIASSIVAHPAKSAKGDITLLGQLLPAGMDEVCDVWGYVDPDGIHYAVIGDWGRHLGGGVYIVNVEDPTNPFVAGSITGSNTYGFDVKVWQHYVYACNGGGTTSTSRVYDIADIQNPGASLVFPSHHNFPVHPAGYLFAESPGLVAYDIATNPMYPAFLWAQNLSGGHDSYPIGDRLYDFHGTSGTFVFNIADRLNPVLLGSIIDPNIAYHHSGCPTPDGRYLYLCDELALNPRPDVTIWDIDNPANPVLTNAFGDPTATVHNLYIVGGFAFASYYSAGFRVYDTSNPASPVLLDTWDTSASTGENYNGCFGVYPFADNGVIYVTDFDNGLFLFQVEGYDSPVSTGVGAPEPATLARLSGNFPNPFNPSTTIRYELDAPMHVQISVHDATGRIVRTLVDRAESAGAYETTWDGRNHEGRGVASGVYFCRLSTAGGIQSRRMILIK